MGYTGGTKIPDLEVGVHYLLQAITLRWSAEEIMPVF